MIFSSGKRQTVYVSPRDLFTTEKKTLPGVTVYADEEAAKRRSVQRKGMSAGKQWYAAEIPAADTFLYRTKPVAEQPFPALHRLLSRKSLSLLFAGEFAVFRWQLSCYIRDTNPEEARALSARETAAFCHEKRNVLLALASGGELINFVKEKATRNEPETVAAYFSALAIPGVIDEQEGAAAFLLFNPRASLTIISIHREPNAYPAISIARSMT
ncbi:MAG: hypothetical protein LBH57_02020 [Treponema sp.]|jgi:hypothetical protein|nr:hypothetical protein [Treponema sp.]